MDIYKFFLARRLDRPSIIKMTEKDVLNIPGFEWAIFRLGTMSTVASIEIDTNHFKGNAPEYVTIEGTARRGDYTTTFNDTDWIVIVDKMKVQPHKLHVIKKEIKYTGPFNCVRIIMAPDGGISRVRVFGQVFIEKIEKNGTNEIREEGGQNCGHDDKNKHNEKNETLVALTETPETAKSIQSGSDQSKKTQQL